MDELGDRDTQQLSQLGLLIEVLRLGAEEKLAEYLETEREEYLARFVDHRDDAGKRLVCAAGHSRARVLQTDIGPVVVRRPRVRDRRAPEEREHFESQLLPAGLREVSRGDLEDGTDPA